MKKANKLHNFTKALERLKEAVTEYSAKEAEDIIRDGLIQRFEFTYELSWKATKEVLNNLGITDINSPKAVFKEAFAQNIIDNEDVWLTIIKDRNMTSHVYKEETADEIALRIVSEYIDAFQKLLNNLKKINVTD